MNHINTLQAVASPTLRAIMDDTAPARLRIRQMAAKLECALVAGEYKQLSDDQRFSLRCLVFALDAVADDLGEDARPAVAKPAPKKWRFWL